jgi:hypothetical protein
MRHAARGSGLGLVAAGLLISGLPARAQQTDTNVGIATISAGGIFGLGAHGSAGASLADPVSKYLAPFIDFSYSPLTSYAFTYGANLTGKGLYRSYLLDVNGGISGFGATATVNRSNDDLAGNASARALFCVTQHVGFGMELKGYMAQHNRFGRASAGVFYQFP